MKKMVVILTFALLTSISSIVSAAEQYVNVEFYESQMKELYNEYGMNYEVSEYNGIDKVKISVMNEALSSRRNDFEEGKHVVQYELIDTDYVSPNFYSMFYNRTLATTWIAKYFVGDDNPDEYATAVIRAEIDVVVHGGNDDIVEIVDALSLLEFGVQCSYDERSMTTKMLTNRSGVSFTARGLIRYSYTDPWVGVTVNADHSTSHSDVLYI